MATAAMNGVRQNRRGPEEGGLLPEGSVPSLPLPCACVCACLRVCVRACVCAYVCCATRQVGERLLMIHGPEGQAAT